MEMGGWPPPDTDRRKNRVTGPSGWRDDQPVIPLTAGTGIKALSWSALASLLAGLGALGFLTVGRFSVGLAGFAPMAHIWTVWSVSAATVGFGAQIETVDRLFQGRGPFSVRHTRLALVGIGVAFVATFVWRLPLFGSTSLFWPVVSALIPAGSLLTGVARGTLAAMDERRRLAFVIAGENLVRFGLAIGLAWTAASPQLLALALLAGFAVALIGLSSVRIERKADVGRQLSSGAAGALAGLVAHASLVLPPSVLALRGEDAAVVAGVFLVLTYLRAPYQFLLGLGPVLTAHSFAKSQGIVGAWLADGRRIAVLSVAGMLAAAAFGLLGGNLISEVMLGRTDIIQPIDYAILCALVVVVGSSILRTLSVLSDGQRGLVVRSWGTAAVVAIGAAFMPGGPTLLFGGLCIGVIGCLVQLTIGSSSVAGSSPRGND